MKKILFIATLIACTTTSISSYAQEQAGTSTTSDSFADKLPKPLRWIAKNWNRMDSTYCIPDFYVYSLQFQDNMSKEYLDVKTNDGHELNFSSRLSNKVGPYFGYRWLSLGLSWEIFSKAAKRRKEFQMSINSQLLNIDLIYRRTGGDFQINKSKFIFGDTADDIYSLMESRDIGDYITYDVTGVDVSYFTNHLKYSNPAGYSNLSLQLRSAGSPVLGIGYLNQKMRFSFFDNNDLDYLRAMYETQNYTEALCSMLREGHTDANMKKLASFLFARVPDYVRLSNLHLQLGYAYNWVLSRRWLVSASFLAMPGLKWGKVSNQGTLAYNALVLDNDNRTDGLSIDAYKDELQKYNANLTINDIKPSSNNITSLNVDIKGLAAITYNHDRWRAGARFQYNNNNCSNSGLRFDNTYWRATAYLHYCFGRKKDFRYYGTRRTAYIETALSREDMEAIRDSFPKSNIGRGETTTGFEPTTNNQEPRTKKYHKDEFRFNVFGCDLVRDADGGYGSFTVEDGYISPGEDSECRITVGKVFDIGEDGAICIEVGHRSNYRTGNWWKSHLDILQTTREHYPDMLHYALKGRLVLNLRGRVFGERRPVRIVLKDFYIGHGSDGSSFFCIGGVGLVRRSTYSLTTNIDINGRKYRLFFEESDTRGGMDLYVSKVEDEYSHWMERCGDGVPVSRLCLPGTHDAGTSTIPESQIYMTAHTQNFPIIDQTRDGIRCFDIRLKRDMRFGHTFKCLEDFYHTMEEWDAFLNENPSEFLIAMIGSDEGGRWPAEMRTRFQDIVNRYPHRFVQDISPTTPLGMVRGKILVLKRQAECPYGVHVQFQTKGTIDGEKKDFTRNDYFDSGFFRITDNFKQFKTAKKLLGVERSLREAYEQEDDSRWYITFNSVSWSPRRHTPEQYALGGRYIRHPLNQGLYETIELKDYTGYGIVMLDFYNGHGESTKLVRTIIESNE